MLEAMSPTLEWPAPPDVAEPQPAQPRRAWGKLPYEERYRRQRSDLLRSAARIATREGYAGTRIADIVSEAGLSKGTFYEHFASKEDCFVELYRRTNAAMLRAGIAAAEANLDRGPYQTISAVIRALTGYVARDPRLAEVLRAEVGASQPAIEAERTANLQRIAELFSALGSRVGSPLPAGELGLVSRVLVRGVTAVLGEVRGAHDASARIDAIARMGCRALGVPDA